MRSRSSRSADRRASGLDSVCAASCESCSITSASRLSVAATRVCSRLSAKRIACSGLGGQLVLLLVGALGQAPLQPALRQPMGDVGLGGTRQLARQFLAVELVQRALQAFMQRRGRQRALAIHQQALQQADDFRGVGGGQQLPLGLFAQGAVTGDAFAVLHAARTSGRTPRGRTPRSGKGNGPAERCRARGRFSACRPLR